MASNKAGYQSSTWNEQSPYKPSPWRSTVAAPSCAFCNKAVFPAEEVKLHATLYSTQVMSMNTTERFIVLDVIVVNLVHMEVRIYSFSSRKYR
jgi:hypothetical protein